MFGSLLTTLGIAALKNEVQAKTRRLTRRVAFGAATGLLLVLAFSFGLAAFTVWLAGEVGTVQALAIVAAAMLVIAGIVWLVGRAIERSEAAPAARAFRPQPLASAPLADAADGAPRPEGEVPTGSFVGSLAVIAVLGFTLARQLFKR
jgi:hypothetical protein